MSVVIGDWGNSKLRLWRIEDGRLAEHREGPGIAQAGVPVAALAVALEGWSEQRVILCGMAGARDGLREAPYVPCPAGASAWLERAAEFELNGWLVTLAAGLSSRGAEGRPDVMRGEETQIFGAMALEPMLAQGTRQIVLPGTHNKWASLVDGRITEFRTFMTGELYDLLKQSSLCVADGGSETEEDAGFATGLERCADGYDAAWALFEARAAQLLDGKSSAWARGFVSGLLIGGEIRAMRPSGRVLVIGNPALIARYGKALAHFGVPFESADGADCVIAGLELLSARH